MRSTLPICGAIAATASVLHAQPSAPYLVKDVYTAPTSCLDRRSNWSEVQLADGSLLFTARSLNTGVEVFRADSNGISLVKDIYPGPTPSLPGPMAVFNGVAYFTADDGVHGRELWRSDGTPAGTFMLVDIYPGASSSSPAAFTVWNNQLMFWAEEAEHGRELWRTDGTAAGTYLWMDINPGPTSSVYQSEAGSMTVLNGALLFGARDSQNHGQVFRTFGTAPGQTTRIGGGFPFPDIYDYPYDIAASANFLYCTVNSTLYFSDGTQWYANTDPSSRYVVGFKALTNGIAMQMRPGPSTYLDMVRIGYTDIFPIDNNNREYRAQFGVLGNKVYFGTQGNMTDTEPWVSDGTPAGTFRLADAAPALYNNQYSFSSNPAEFTPFGNRMYFAAASVPPFGVGYEPPALWSSDGTTAGTAEFKPASATSRGALGLNAQHLAASGSNLYYWANQPGESSETPLSLWRTDGTPETTVRLGSATGGTYGSYPTFVGTALGKQFFATSRPAYALWITDGTDAGTVQLLDGTTAAWYAPATVAPNVAAVSGKFIFQGAQQDVTGGELWVSDGTVAGTHLVMDINPGSAYSSPEEFNSNGTLAIFRAKTAQDGTELWATDGTAAGTHLVKDIWPGTASSNPRAITRVGNVWVFVAHDGTHGIELWRTDGTTDGTWMLADTTAGVNGTFSASNSSLFFTSGNGYAYYSTLISPRIYRTDGNSAPELLGAVPQPYSNTNPVNWMGAANGYLYLWSNSSASNQSYLSRYTQPGVFPTTLVTNPSLVALSPPNLYYQVSSQGEIRRLDTTTGNITSVLASANTYSNLLTPIPGGGICFATNYSTWDILYAGATGAAVDLGTIGISPDYFSGAVNSPLTFTGGHVYFPADDGVHGQEVWSVAIPNPATDCNGNGIADADDILMASSPDVNHDGTPDECECLARWAGYGTAADVLAFVGDWMSARADFNHSGATEVQDIYDFLNAWFRGCP